MGVRTGVFLVLITFITGCAEGHCRRKTDQPAEAKPVETPAEQTAAATAADTTKPTGDTVFVYKYDGSLQCRMGKAVTPEAMAKELAGIPIVSSAKKPDGLMHIQVCGSITGKANVYEIPSKYLKQAEGKGFKRWSFE